MPDLHAQNHDRGINMHVVTEVQHIVILAEHKLLDLSDIDKRFNQIAITLSALARRGDGRALVRLLL